MPQISDPAKQLFDDLVTGADREDRVVFLVKFTLVDSTVLYSQMARPPGYRKLDAEARPDVFLPSLNLSILNSSPLQAADNEKEFPSLRESSYFRRFSVGLLTYGALEIANADGERNSWADGTYVWNGAAGEVQIGRESFAPAAFETFFPFKVAGEPGWEGGRQAASNKLKFDLISAQIDLDLPAQEETFAGTGGTEGEEQNTGNAKPRLFGDAYGKPIEIHAEDRRYMITGGAGGYHNLEAVYYGGSAEDIAAVTLNPANGTFTVPESEVQGEVAYHAQGEKVNAGVYSSEPGHILKFWLESEWGGTAAGTAQYTLDHNHVHGIVWNPGEDLTRSGMLDRFLAPLGLGYVEQDGTAFRTDILKAPESLATPRPVAFTDREIQKITAEPGIPPVWRVAVSYLERPVPREVVTANTSAHNFWSAPRTHKFASDPAVKAAYPRALDVVIVTSLQDGTAAQTVADAFLAIYKVPRRIFNVTLARRPMDSWAGIYPSIQSDYPTVPGLATPKTVLTTGMRLDFESRRFVMECWG